MALRSRQRLGKYKIERRVAEGGFANVYQALDTIEGVRVALKVPHARLVNASTLNEFRREARLVARLDHPQILTLKNADFRNADDHLFLRSACRRFGIWYSRAGNGVSHPVHMERFGIPGKTLLGSDSHTPAAGSLGMLAIEIAEDDL